MLRRMLCLVTVAALGCSANSSTQGVDAGPFDASVPDAGSDAGTTDAGFDAGPADAGVTDGGAPTGEATLSGSTAGVRLNPADAITFVDPTTPNGAIVTVSSSAPACFDLQNGIARENQSVLRFVLRNQDSSLTALPLTTGTYQVMPSTTAAGLTATAAIATTDSECAATLQSTADLGTVTVTDLNTAAGGTIHASFTLQFGADSMTGIFDAPVCTTSSTTSTSCLE